jgi:hypothetical protein
VGLKKQRPPFARREGAYYSPRFYFLTALLVFPEPGPWVGIDLGRDLAQRNENETAIKP